MILEGSNNSSAINWVRQDLDQCLESVRDQLEAFARDTSLREPLIAVQEELERLNLTFQTMQQRGASLLTDEMIAVGGHMLHNGHANCADSLNALTDAVIVLPSYLDRLQAGHDDLPILLLPTLNELRATYDESLLSEGTLFAPELDVIVPELSGSEADAIAASGFAAFARRVRSLYQGPCSAGSRNNPRMRCSSRCSGSAGSSTRGSDAMRCDACGGSPTASCRACATAPSITICRCGACSPGST